MKNMKTISLFTLMISVSLLQAQKAKVVSAYNYNKAYERDKDCSDLKKGIESIESATKDEKTQGWAKTWYYGGNLYFNAAMTKDAECKSQFEGALTKTYNAYMKALKYNIESDEAAALNIEKQEDLAKMKAMIFNKETDLDDPTYTRDILNQRFPYMALAFTNTGVEAFQAEDYEAAKEYSEKSIIVNLFLNRFDSLGMFNAALASERLKEYDDAIAYFTALASVGYGGAELYLYMASIYDIQGDTTKKVAVIQAGRKAYPKDANLITEELNYLISTGQTQAALSNFDDAIEADPTNSSLFYNRGVIYDGLDSTEKAASDYSKALELDTNFFDAAYNLGAMYYNKGAEWNNTASSLPLNAKTKYKEAEAKAKAYFQKAAPALEKAHAINPEDKPTMASLTKIYAIQGQNEKYSAMKKKLGQ